MWTLSKPYPKSVEIFGGKINKSIAAVKIKDDSV
jgi:hypothetical protein